MRQQLGQICNAPLEEMIKKTRDDLDLKALRSAGRALLKDKQNKIPDERRKELTELIGPASERSERSGPLFFL